MGLRSIEQSRSAQGSSSCPNARENGALILRAATSSTMQSFASDLVITQHTFLSFFACVPLTSPAPTESCAALRPNTDDGNVQLVNNNAKSAAGSPRVMQNHE